MTGSRDMIEKNTAGTETVKTKPSGAKTMGTKSSKTKTSKTKISGSKTSGSSIPNRRQLGAKFESLAAGYLEKEGYRILAKNFRSYHGEIDLVAEDHGVLVFIEVKYRTNAKYGTPFDAVGWRKQQKIIQAAEYYRLANRVPEYVPCRFDVIGFTNGRLEHIKNAFET